MCASQEADGDFELPEDMQLDEGEPDGDEGGEDSGDEAPPEAEGLNEEGGEFKEADAGEAEAEPKPTSEVPEPPGPEGASSALL